MKKAIIFSDTDGHGVCMGVISRRNLEAAGYEVEHICRFPETGKPSQFWGDTFQKWNFEGIDLIATTDIPLPEYDGTYPNAVQDALTKISQLTSAGTKVVIIDHHKVTETHYGAARSAGAQVIITSSATTCYWGGPSDFAEKWGRFGAICDRDDAVLPVKSEDEEIAAGIDTAIRSNLAESLEAIERDDVEYFRKKGRLPEIPGKVTVIGNVTFASETTPKWGFKQLSNLVDKSGTDYGVSVDCSRNHWRVLAITGWKKDALPVALKLGLSRFIGHGAAIIHYVTREDDPKGRELATAKAQEFIARLNADKPVSNGENNGNGADKLFSYVSAFMRKVSIPFFLTQHGWPHVQRVVANVRTLGSLFNLSERDRRVLDWVALFHDVGNGANTYYPELGLTDKEARARHHEFSAQMIREWHSQGLFKGILSDEDVERVADLSFRHRKKVPLPEDPHEAMVCTLFRVSDGMDIDARRAQRNDEGKFFEDLDLPEDSVPHWEGHRAIEAMRIVASEGELVFELVVTNSDKAAFQVAEVSKELACLTPYCSWKVAVVKK